MTAATQNWVPFASTCERGYKFADVDVEKIVPCKIKYPISSQREKHTLFQTKMVKIYTLFQIKIA